MKRNWKTWIKAAGVRAIKTVAQTAVATIGTSAVLGDVNWIAVGSASALAGVLSLLTVIEGNYKNAVSYREIAVGGRYIRGYCLPDYASMAVEETAPSAKPSTEKVGKEITITVHQLSKGCKGEEVRALQALLILRGFDCGKSGTDGSFGTDTDKAVRAAQQHYGLDVDGYAGAKTLAALWRIG